MFDLLFGIIELCFVSIWGVIGIIAGLTAAALVWNLAEPDSRAAWAAVTYAAVFVVCLGIGHRKRKEQQLD